MDKAMLLDQKVVWVVGASGAIGRAVCQRFAHHGAQLVMSSRRPQGLADLRDTIRSEGDHDPKVMPLDVVDDDAVRQTAEEVVGSLGRIDVLVNSTAVPMFRDFDELSDDDWLTVFNAKLFAYVRTTRAVIPHMVANGGGAVINVSGRGGHQPGSVSHIAGSSANGAIHTLTKALSNRYASLGIRINAVAPGPVVSERYNQIMQADDSVRPGSGGGAAGGSDAGDDPVPYIRPMAEPLEIADVALFLASGMSRFMTGTILQADGGGTRGI